MTPAETIELSTALKNFTAPELRAYAFTNMIGGLSFYFFFLSLFVCSLVFRRRLSTDAAFIASFLVGLIVILTTPFVIYDVVVTIMHPEITALKSLMGK